MIWTDTLLDELAEDAAKRINADVLCLYHKFYLATTTGLSVYTLPTKVKSISRITWLGKKIDPLSWEEMQIMNPMTAFVSGAINIETSVSRPQWYALHPTNYRDIRFYPTPDLTLSATGGDPYSPTVNEQRCNITCWRNIDLTDSLASLPSYIDRRTRKAYILWKAFEKESKGQDAQAANYYKKKYQFLVKMFIAINEGCFVSQKYALDDHGSTYNNNKYPKPQLPSNYERVDY